MVQKRVAFEKTKQLQEALALDDISPNWAKRLGEQQQGPTCPHVDHMTTMVF